MMKTSELLKEAAAELRRRGHTKFALLREDRVCLFGALNAAVTGNPERFPPAENLDGYQPSPLDQARECYVDFQGLDRECLAGGEGCGLTCCPSARPASGGWGSSE